MKANKLSLNVKKTELIIFRQKKKPLDHSVKFKLNGKRLLPTSSVRYLGVFFDEHLYSNKQLAHITTKLNQGIVILSKLRHCANLNMLKIVYHSLVRSHLHYGASYGAKPTRKILTKYKNLTLRLHDPTRISKY